MCAPQNRDSERMEQKLIKLKGKTDKTSNRQKYKEK